MAQRPAKKVTRKAPARSAVAKGGRSPMSDEHKAALARGREQGRIVRAYLDALEAHRPKRGRKRTTDSIERQLAEAEAKLAGATGLDRVLLAQRQLDLRHELELARRTSSIDLSALEDRFVEVAKEYSRAKGISYSAWREVGVDAALLRRAGIARAGD
jgi:hypothetical protein